MAAGTRVGRVIPPCLCIRRRAQLCTRFLMALMACSVFVQFQIGLRPSIAHALTWHEFFLLLLWSIVTNVGSRRVTGAVSSVFPQYNDTVFDFPLSEFPGVSGLVALTIDDGICRQEASHSMLTEVLDLLRNHSARATFFITSNYARREDLSRIIAEGHELGNHLPKDTSYASLDSRSFQNQLLATEVVLAPYLRQAGGRRWFRAPQGRLTWGMVQVLRKLKMTHVLGDSYADDWAITSPALVAKLYERQMSAGSIAIMHMPERGFREHTYETIRLVLLGLHQRGLGAVTLGELDRAAHRKVRII
eukprot:TRINITY_DN57294_c0_g1_i1.p1 TRINITY_DN57294_c0_g1~~TRINITY_DN57294_c0_g1_i1.p1  ORF type:complete len:305 (-),score=27.56 TRINITY_DN57294_c0_g1_i1:124-1038(-)